MTPQWKAHLIGLLIGFVAGLALASLFGLRGATLSEWILRGGEEYTLVTYTAGGAFAGFLGAWSAIKWRGVGAAVLIILSASLVGATMSVPGSLFLVCHYWGYSNMGCSGLGALRLSLETPFIWFLLAIATTIVVLVARRIAGQASPSAASKPSIHSTTTQWSACVIALPAGFVAGCALAVLFGYQMRGSTTWGDWILHGGENYMLFTYPAGAAVAGFLGAYGAMRWGSASATVLVVAISSLVGAVISLPGSVLLVCHYRDRFGAGCGDFSAFRLAFETPFIWTLFAVVTMILAAWARRVAGPASA